MDKKTVKKQEIIKSSIEIMFEHGYNGTGVKDLTDAAGIPKGSFYNYFVNKEDYAKEALEYYHYEMGKNQSDTLTDKNLKPVERIKQFFTTMIEGISHDATFHKGCFVGKMTQEMSGVSDAIQVATDQLHMDVIHKITVNIEEAIEIGMIDKDKDSALIAEFIYNSWHGALQRLKSTRDRKTLDNFYKIMVEVLLK